jgi:hypothetical protein
MPEGCEQSVIVTLYEKFGFKAIAKEKIAATSRTRPGGTTMPVVIIDIPSGLPWSTKSQLHKEVSDSMHHAYPMPDNRVYLREWTPEQTSFDGVIGGSFRPVVHYVVPPIITAETRKKLVSSVGTTVARALDLRPWVETLPTGQKVSTLWVLQFFFEVPLELAALDDMMAVDNPMIPKGKH